MARFESSVTIDAPVEEVFEFAKDIGKLWTCWPGVAVRDVVLTPDGVGSHAHWFERLLFLHREGRVEFTEVVPHQRIVATSSTTSVFTFTFTPREDGRTDLSYIEEWSWDVPVVGRPAEQMAVRMGAGFVRQWQANLKAAVEGRAPDAAWPAQEAPAATLTRSVVIQAPLAAVLDDVLNIGTFWAGAPDVAVRDVTLTPEGVGSSARIYTHWLGFHMEGVIEVVEAAQEFVAIKAAFGPEGPLWTFSLDVVEGGTKLTGRGEWHMNVPGVGGRLGTWAAAAHEEFLDGMLASAKRRVEASAGRS